MLLGISDEIGDSAFDEGLLADPKTLGDQGTDSPSRFIPDWIDELKQDIHFVAPVLETLVRPWSRKWQKLKIFATLERRMHACMKCSTFLAMFDQEKRNFVNSKNPVLFRFKIADVLMTSILVSASTKAFRNPQSRRSIRIQTLDKSGYP